MYANCHKEKLLFTIIYCGFKMIAKDVVEEASVFVILKKQNLEIYMYYLSPVIYLGRTDISKLKHPTWKIILK